MKSVLEKAEESIRLRQRAALCTVVSTSGSVPLKAGAKMLVYSNGTTFGTIGGGNVERQVTADAVLLVATGHPELKVYHLLELNMCCGGTMTLFIEPLKIKKQLLIFGAGHIGSRVASFAQALDFSVTLIDKRSQYLAQVDFAGIAKHHMSHSEAFPLLHFDDQTYIVICTHQHVYDKEILAHCVLQPQAYVGMIGSMRKVHVTRKLFLQKKICTQEQLDTIDMPIGYDFGQNSPAEIALGIIAKILAVSNGKNEQVFIQKIKSDEINSDSDRCS